MLDLKVIGREKGSFEFPAWTEVEMGSREGERRKMTDNERRAHKRVNETPELQQYSDVIFCEGHNLDEHMKWVAKVPAVKIIDWAKSVRRWVPADKVGEYVEVHCDQCKRTHDGFCDILPLPQNISEEREE